MSAEPHYQAAQEAHTGPIKNPKQLLLAVGISFIVPILVIVALVAYVTSGNKPAGSATGDNMALTLRAPVPWVAAWRGLRCVTKTAYGMPPHAGGIRNLRRCCVHRARAISAWHAMQRKHCNRWMRCPAH